MPSQIRRLTVDQFVALVQAATLTRKIDAVHLHHTWRPTRAQFKGLASVEAMRNYHMNTNGWSDIAQHLTVDPQGFLWTGRNWNSPPASQAGKNGTRDAGPFMIEIVGDFDAGREDLDGEQRRAVVEVVAVLIRRFGLNDASVLFHRELGSPKSCPGSGVDKSALVAEIGQARSAPPVARARAKAAKAAPPFGPQHWLGHEVTLPADEPQEGFEGFGVPEHDQAAHAISDEARARVLGQSDAGAVLSRGLACRTSWPALRPYVVNLTRGRLSQGGEFCMPDGAIEGIVESIRQYAAAVAQPRLMLHAHGGLVSEQAALQYAQDAYGWWLTHEIYPIYFIWETSFLEILKQRLGLARGPVGDARDYMFESLVRAAGGKSIWSDMKESALLASSVDAGRGEAGGARIFAQALAPVLKAPAAGPGMEVHAVGHSAGAIFQAHLLPVLIELGATIDSLAFLAPAIRIDLFKEMLIGPITSGQIKSFAEFTMDEEAERDDDLVEPLGVTVYGKSLLYLISRALEPKRKTEILGLDEMLRADAQMMALFNGTARLELSRAAGKPPNQATKAKKHGCFDNDEATMGSVLETILGSAPGTPFPAISAECGEGAVRSAARLAVSIATLPGAFSAVPHGAGVADDRAAAEARRALCVGIDSYRDSPLSGCVRDATAWASVLRQLDFQVTTVLDREATRQAVLDALKALVTGARPGELLVFQYSGHGTQAEDLNGDEADRYDEALVPVDYHTGALLLDDDLAEVYRRLPRGVVLTLFMDCCHSGTNSRFAPIDRSAARGLERRRFLPLSPQLEEAHRRFRAREGSPPPTNAEESLPGVIHFAACLDNQYAYESEGQGHFTRVASASLANAVSRRITNEDYALELTSKVVAMGRPQTPKLMQLPADLSGRPVLAGASGALPGSTAMPAQQEWDERCLQFFEAGAAHLRQRLGR
jgi:caspase domain-containing protein/N-acetylmuramoyl-L-alanine amidase-like protein